jgi:mono/diheme cytochrome c family protein
MKKLAGTLGMVVFMLFANTAVGEVVVKEEPLEWQDVAHLEGDVVFSNLCAACHGTGGKGDGPAAGALKKGVPNLTVLSTNNDGVYPYFQVRNAIAGMTRVVEHGTIDMPVWGEQFAYVRPGDSTRIRESYARRRIRLLTTYIQSLQS